MTKAKRLPIFTNVRDVPARGTIDAHGFLDREEAWERLQELLPEGLGVDPAVCRRYLDTVIEEAEHCMTAEGWAPCDVAACHYMREKAQLAVAPQLQLDTRLRVLN